MTEGQQIECVRVELTLSKVTCQLLATLDRDADPVAALRTLADHAAQGVYRPGAWEREWLLQAFPGDFLEHLEPGDPYGRPGGDLLFTKPSAEFLERLAPGFSA